MPLGRCRARAARVRRWRAWQRMGRSWDSPRARRRQPKGGRCCRRSSAVVRSSNGASDIRAPWFKARQNEATAARSRAPSWLLATSGTRTKHEEAVFFNAPLLFIYIKERTSSHFFASPEAPPLAVGRFQCSTCDKLRQRPFCDGRRPTRLELFPIPIIIGSIARATQWLDCSMLFHGAAH